MQRKHYSLIQCNTITEQPLTAKNNRTKGQKKNNAMPPTWQSMKEHNSGTVQYV